VESEASKSSEVLKETLEGIKGTMGHVIEEAGKTELAKKAGECAAVLCFYLFTMILVSGETKLLF
jgi:hypothetical protein